MANNYAEDTKVVLVDTNCPVYETTVNNMMTGTEPLMSGFTHLEQRKSGFYSVTLQKHFSLNIIFFGEKLEPEIIDN